MPYQHFQIPCAGGEAETELNRFLQERRILKVEKQFVAAGLDSFWAYQIHYEAGAIPTAGTFAGSGKKGMIDYKALLSDEDFSLFLTLKEHFVWLRSRGNCQILSEAKAVSFTASPVGNFQYKKFGRWNQERQVGTRKLSSTIAVANRPTTQAVLGCPNDRGIDFARSPSLIRCRVFQEENRFFH